MQIFIQKWVQIEEILVKLNIHLFDNKIGEKTKNSIKKEFDREPVYNVNYLTTKIKS